MIIAVAVLLVDGGRTDPDLCVAGKPAGGPTIFPLMRGPDTHPSGALTPAAELPWLETP
jgi:hypothetical protein